MRIGTKLTWLLAVAACLWAGDGLADPPKDAAPEDAQAPSTESEPAPWCAPELPVLPGEVCYFVPDKAQPTELLIFLHGVIKADTTWQWSHQRAALRTAQVHKLATIIPRGRRQIRTDSMADWWTWPTGPRAQQLVEQEILDEWQRARLALEQQLGRKFTKVYVWGFSNGANYVTSLALRGRLSPGAVDGYAAFAGEWAPAADERTRRAFRHVPRVPFFVGYGGLDKPAVRGAEKLRQLLRALGWPSKVVGRPKAGHAMTDAHAREAIEFLRR